MSDRIKPRSIAVDCPDPRALMRFYGEITGWAVRYEDDEWCVLKGGEDDMRICFARVPDYQVPTWPEGPVAQQMHLEFSVDDFDATEARVLAAGATKAGFQPGDDFRVYLDPVGHPFCLCR